MTWTQALIKSNVTETWRCTRLLNSREVLLVLVAGNRRYRADTRKITSKRELVEDGWTLHHRLDLNHEEEAPQ